MAFSAIFDVTFWATLIEFLGALLIVFYLLRACITLLCSRNLLRARILVADGVLLGLSFKLAGTLLRTIVLQTWQQILMFIAIFALRTLLKYVFTWEHERLQQNIDEEMIKRQGVEQTKPKSRSLWSFLH